MKRSAFRGNRGVLLRSYLIIAGGLILVSTAMDAVFSHFQQPPHDPLLEGTASLIAERIAKTAPEQWSDLAKRITQEIGIPLQIINETSVSGSVPADGLQAVTSQSGALRYFLRVSPGAVIVLGPIDEASDLPWAGLLPTFFYLAIIGLVSIWLWPILKDLDMLTDAARRFAQDYREPLSTSSDTKVLTSLSRSLDEMSLRTGQLIQSQKELTAALSHEMRTPLARMRMAVALLGHQNQGISQDTLRGIDGDIRELDELIRSMLSYARLDHPDTQMCWQTVSIAAWLQRIVDRADAATIELELDAKPNTDVAMDARLMELALSNLLVNALRYGRCRIRVSFANVDDGYRLSVEDDGTGIPESSRTEVFKAFRRLDESRSRHTGGFGLGLAVVRRILQLHGGRAVATQSEALGGARFDLVWNHRSAPQPGSASAARAQPAQALR